MSDRLPSLNALRVFIATARSQSVSRAAEALHLTHSAVSHQIRLLQEELGVTLFTRSGRGLRLTPAAAAYAERVERAFDDLRTATQALVDGQRNRPLRVSSMPSFAARWLLPRLGAFISAHRDLDVEVQSTARLADLKGGEVDVALRFGRGGYSGLFSELLLRDWYYPVCSPEFAQRYALGARHSLAGLPLLRSVDEPWSPWLAAAGFAAEEPERGPAFDDSSLMLLAAAAGQGLCLARHSIAVEEIAAGRLIRPFAAVVEAANAYYFVCRNADRETPAVAAFRAWITAQAAGSPAPA